MRILVAILAGLTLAACTDSTKPAAPAPAPARDPWTAVAIGSVFETKTVTRLVQPFVHETATTTRQTLLARTDTDVAIKLELMSERGALAHDITVPLRAPAAEPCTASTVTSRVDETCTVAAGTFECTRTTVEVQTGDVTRSTVTWTAKDVPVPLKSVVTNENMTTTTELTRVALADR